MKKQEAIALRNQYRDKLIGKKFDGRDDLEVKDVIVTSYKNLPKVYSKMWESNLSNDAALIFFETKEGDYEVFVIAHQWPWGSGHLFHSDLDKYLQRNPI